ncbi:hypothetical protein BGX24_012818 [Mortierella sp. AD032]|nr:hypothetical protein BGX24_012818 [Mortierella sp. AD032]
MSTTSFSDLPVEVQEKIAPFLSQQDLALCLRVCRAWKRLFYVHFWTHLDIAWDGENKIWQKNVGRALRNNKNRCLVRSIKLRLHDDDHFDSFLKQCPQVFPLLTSADFKAPFFEDYDDEAVTRFNRLSSKGWKRLVFRKVRGSMGILEFNKYPFEQFLKRAAPTLEVFRTYSLTLVSMRTVNMLLCKAPNLKELYIYGGADICPDNLYDAEKYADSEWVCKNLEVFGCRIGNIPRPDITHEIRGLPAQLFYGQGSAQESVALQHQIYEKLARLTKLRELTLGFPLGEDEDDYDDNYKKHYKQNDCLAMTLDSGLDRLKGLKNLRKVGGLDDMQAYNVGDKEKVWFAEHWPNVTFVVTDEIAKEENDDDSSDYWQTSDEED